MAQHVINLPCIADTWCELYTNVNNGASTTLKFGTYSMPSRVALLKFDHSLIPLGKRLVNATLKVYNLIARTPYGNGNIYYRVKVQDWQENVLTGATLGSTSDAKTKRFPSFPANNYFDIDITDLNEIANLMGIINGIHLDCYGVSTDTANNYISIASRETANPPILQITYEDIPPDRPTPIEPIGSYKGNTKSIRFSWVYNSTAGDTQKKFDLLWSPDNSTWTTVSQITSNNYYDMPANTLPSGNIYWKVKTYNPNDEVSPESDVSVFYATGGPVPPTILSVTSTSARPIITWSALGQQIYQVQILKGSNVVYDSGNIASMDDTSHKVKSFLADDSYTAKVRIKNEYDIFSDWSSYNFTITTTKPTKPPISINTGTYEINILSSLLGNSYLLLYRAGAGEGFKCIAKYTVDNIADYSIESNTEYQYFVRAVSSSETFNDSDIVTVAPLQMKNATIAPVTDLTDIFEVKFNLNNKPARNINMSAVGSSAYLSGRKYQITEYSEHIAKSITVNFFVKLDTGYDEISKLLDKVILYRDKRRKLYANVTGLNISDHPAGYIVSLSLNKTDYSEEVEI